MNLLIVIPGSLKILAVQSQHLSEGKYKYPFPLQTRNVDIDCPIGIPLVGIHKTLVGSCFRELPGGGQVPE